MTAQRLRITFSKRDAARFMGHLDLHRAWERTLRRAGLPVAYSEGFHPQPKLQFASALSLGFSSEAEVLDVTLSAPVALDDARTELARATPPGMAVRAVAAVALDPDGKKPPSLQSLLREARYTITLRQPRPALAQQVDALLARESIPRQRKKSVYDLRPLIYDLHVDAAAPETVLHAHLSAREGATGRPQDLLALLAIAPHEAQVHRTALVLADEGEQAGA